MSRYFKKTKKHMIVVERENPPTEEEWEIIIKDLEG